MMEILFSESAAGGLVCARLCKSADVLSLRWRWTQATLHRRGIGRARMDTLRALFSFAPGEIGEEAARHCFAAAKAGWESAKNECWQAKRRGSGRAPSPTSAAAFPGLHTR